MDARRFIEVATDPKAWRKKSAALRRCGNALWDRFVAEWMGWAGSHDKERGIADSSRLDAAGDFLAAAQMFYGLALETAFKAHLLEESPEETEIIVSYDGSGKVTFAEAKQIGIPLREGHNLLRLAEKVGVFRRGEGALFEHDSDFRAVREILLHLSDAVRWRVRYPVPTRSDRVHTKPDDLPGKIFGHYIRDWLDLVMDRYIGPSASAVAGMLPMVADLIYRELGKHIVVFQWLENRLHQIAWALISPDGEPDPRGKTAGFWFKELVDFATKEYVTYIDTHDVHAPEEHKRDFLVLMERCRAAADFRNRMVHSTYVHLEAGGELAGILRSKMSCGKDETGGRTLELDQEPLSESTFDDAIGEIGDLGIQLGLVHTQLIHWSGRPEKAKGQCNENGIQQG